ncbi:hypothetical protein NQ318_019230 [Aromia moschata]|uniref:Zinc finger protein n=1 Tax=Aromia moschata TaxID=1265417 RepID=A0AAV8Z0E9_9CUCU|nr:hypothetical protein NQ318_019230 [Aromia moschata]
MVRKSYINAGNVIKLCRVCLTQSNNVMYELSSDIVLDDIKENHIPILEALEKVVAKKVLESGELPQYICPICVSMLKMTFKFVCQFEETQKKLMKKLGKSTDELLKDGPSHGVKSDMSDSDQKNDLATVEIIYRENKFDLKNVIVVEEENEEETNYRAFLKNLGQEVSASFARKSKRKPDAQPYSDNVVSIYVTDSENGVLPIKELKIDDDTNTIDYVILDDDDKKYNDDSVQSSSDMEDNGIEYIKIETQEDDFIETLIIENDEADDIEINKENNTLKFLNVHDVIDSLIIERTDDDDDAKEKVNNVDHPRAKKVIKVGKKRKEIVEKKFEDRIIMGPADKNEDVGKERSEEDEIFEREVQFPCELCKKIFPHKTALRAHVRRSHCPKDKQYTCEICGYKTKTRSGYVHHKNKHFGKKFTCEVCSKTYYTRAVLKVHMGTHVNKRQHLCNVCGKGFNYANALAAHRRTKLQVRVLRRYIPHAKLVEASPAHPHWREALHLQLLQQGVLLEGELQCHENIHTGFRPYHCKHCMKGFTKTHNLKLHLLSHTGPHGCEICGKSFIEMSILSMHYKIAHKNLLEREDEDEEQL